MTSLFQRQVIFDFLIFLVLQTNALTSLIFFVVGVCVLKTVIVNCNLRKRNESDLVFRIFLVLLPLHTAVCFDNLLELFLFFDLWSSLGFGEFLRLYFGTCSAIFCPIINLMINLIRFNYFCCIFSILREIVLTSLW